jgi:hypothetical protein
MPARNASKAPLHTTFIRNEAAYFMCVAQLLAEHPVPLPPPTPKPLRLANEAPSGAPAEESSPPIFLLGDSHCLSGDVVLGPPGTATRRVCHAQCCVLVICQDPLLRQQCQTVLWF